MPVKKNTTTPEPYQPQHSAPDPLGEMGTDLITFELKYGINQKSLFVTVETQVDPTSVSDRYITVHLPMSENQSKSSFEFTSTGKAKLETIYDRPMDSCLVNALITAGSSTYDVTVNVSSRPTSSKDATGTTGTPVQVIVVL